MKKIVKLFIMLFAISATTVFAQKVNTTDDVIGSTDSNDTLLCSYKLIDLNDAGDKGEFGRVSIYFNDQNDTFSVYWDNSYQTSAKHISNPDLYSKKGSFNDVFSKNGKNIYNAEEGKKYLKDKKCPPKVKIHWAQNRMGFEDPGKNVGLKKTFDINRDSIDEGGGIIEGTPTSQDKIDSLYDSSLMLNVGDDFCYDDNILRGMKIVGLVITLAKVIIPIILIIVGSLELFKAVTAGSPDDELKKKGKSLFIRVIVGALVFFIPTIINVFVNLTGLLPEEYTACQDCILDPFNKC